MTASISTRTQQSVMTASFGGWAGDAFDYQLFSLSLPILLATWTLTPAMAGAISTASLIGAALGGMAGGALSDRFGRVRLLQISIAVVALTSLFCAFVAEPWQLLLARAVQGLGFGAEWSVGAVLLAEIAPSDRRGRFLGIMQSAWAAGWAGAVVVYLAATAFLPAEVAWRVMFGIGILPAGLVLWIRRSIKPPVPATPIPATRAVRAEPLADAPAFLSRNLLLSALVGLAAHGGYHSLFTWLPTLLRTTRGYPSTLTGAVLLCMTVAFAAGCILAGRFADRIGRRPVIALFAAGAVAATAVFASVEANMAVTLALALAVGFAAGGVPAVLGAWFSELFPAAIRGASVGFAYNAGRMASAVLPGIIGWASAFVGLEVLIGIVAAASYGAIVVLLPLLPETHGSSLAGAQA